MAADSHLNPNQLRMFMSAREIMSSFNPGEGDRIWRAPGGRPLERMYVHNRPDRPPFEGAYPESNDELWDRKADESTRYGNNGRHGSLAESVTAQGVQSPIPLGHFTLTGHDRPMVAGGHHRIGAMMKNRPDDLLPVVHHEDITHAKKDPRYT